MLLTVFHHLLNMDHQINTWVRIPKQRPELRKNCTMCGKEFTTITKSKNICSFICKRNHNRIHARFYARLRRFGPLGKKEKKYLACIICGFSETTDQHREEGGVFTLCPNHHCLITRNIKTLKELLIEKDLLANLVK